MASPETDSNQLDGCSVMIAAPFIVAAIVEHHLFGTDRILEFFLGDQNEQDLQSRVFSHEHQLELDKSVQHLINSLAAANDTHPEITIPQSLISAKSTDLITNLDQEVANLLSNSHFPKAFPKAILAVRQTEDQLQLKDISQEIFPQIAQTEAEIYLAAAKHVTGKEAKDYWRALAIRHYAIAHQFDRTKNIEISQNPLTIMVLLRQMDQTELAEQIQLA